MVELDEAERQHVSSNMVIVHFRNASAASPDKLD
jgi:hypothetical protein